MVRLPAQARSLPKSKFPSCIHKAAPQGHVSSVLNSIDQPELRRYSYIAPIYGLGTYVSACSRLQWPGLVLCSSATQCPGYNFSTQHTFKHTSDYLRQTMSLVRGHASVRPFIWLHDQPLQQTLRHCNEPYRLQLSQVLAVKALFTAR